MNRRDFLKHVPKTLCASGAAMYVAGKMLDQQKPILHVEPKPELVVWRHQNEQGHVWLDLRETIVGLDGEIYQKPWGEQGPCWLTKETECFRRAQDVRFKVWTEWNAVQFTMPPDWARHRSRVRV